MRGDNVDKNVVNAYNGGQVIVANDNATVYVEKNNIGANRKKFQNNKKQDYIDNWNSRLFLHIDNDERPITLADAFIMPYYENHIKDARIKLSEKDTMDEAIEKFIKYNRSANMLITGVPGIGKTSIVSWIANEYKENNDIIILRFRDWERDEFYNGLLQVICNTLYCIKRDLENKILILDGFDEIKILDDGEILIKNFFNEILDYRNIKIIITSRTDYINVYLFQYIFKLLPFQINEIKLFYYMITGNNAKSNIDQSNIDVLGIPVILYMAIMTDIDITKKATKPELYGKIFAEKGGIFDKFSYSGIGYDYGNHLLRVEENIKKYLSFLQEIAFKMFDENKLSLPREEEKIPKLTFQGAEISVLEFPIKNLFENTMSNIEFVHKSIYEYFVSEYIIKQIKEVIVLDNFKEKLAGVLGSILKGNKLSIEIIEFLKYKIKNNALKMDYEKMYQTFKLMIKNGMTYYTEKQYKNIIKCVSNVFKNMLDILHLWENVFIVFDDSIHDYFRLDIEELNLSKANLSGLNLKKMDFGEANLTGANLTGADLTGADLTDIKFEDVCMVNTIFDEKQVIYLKSKCNLERSMVYIRKTREVISYKEYMKEKSDCGL